MNTTQTNIVPSFGPPTTVEIVVVPAVILVLFILGLVVLSIYSQVKWRCVRSPLYSATLNHPSVIEPCHEGATRLFIHQHSGTGCTCCNGPCKGQKSSTEMENQQKLYLVHTNLEQKILKKFSMFQNNGLSLFVISLPVLVSLLFCPVTILMYKPLTDFFWPETYTNGMPVINDVVSAFLMPAGLVYAIAFGFAFQDVLNERNNVHNIMQQQIILLSQTWRLLNYNCTLSKANKIYIAETLKDILLKWMAEVVSFDVKAIKGSIWDIIQKLQENGIDKERAEDVFTQKAYDTVFDYLLQLDSSLQNDFHKDHKNINILQLVCYEVMEILFEWTDLVKVDVVDSTLLFYFLQSQKAGI